MKSTYLRNAVNNHVLDGTSFTTPATLYAGLWKVQLAAGDHGGAAGEVSYTGYARVAVTNDGSKFSASSAGTIASSAAIAFPAPTGDADGDVVSVGLFDGNAGTSSDKLLYINDNAFTLHILNGDPAPTIPSGSFTHTEG